MKFTIYVLLTLVSLIASTLAACDCDAADQPCLDKCVTTANGCVVQCQKQNAGDACEQACFAAHWPSMATSLSDATATASASSGALPSAVSTTLATTASSPIKPSMTASMAATATSRPSSEANVSNTSDSHKLVMSWATLLAASLIASWSS